MKGIIILVVLLILIGGGFYLFNNNEAEELPENEDSTMMDDEMMKDEQDDGIMNEKNEMTESMMKEEGMTSQGSYESYSSDKLAMAENGDVVLFFKASWCPSCRALDSDIKEKISQIPDGLTILEIDYDSSTELKKKYGITVQHTLVQVDADGNLIKKWSGSGTLEEVTANLSS